MTGLLILLGCIILLIVAVTVFKVHPIPALLISGLVLGLATGGSVDTVTESLLSGFGGTLKWIGLIILFGTLLGEILAETGGADVIADSIINLFGTKYLPFSMAVIGFLIGIPVFMDVAYLTLLPTILVLSKKSGHSVLVLGLSLAMSLTVAHALIPPTPGPLAVAALLEINIGEIIPLNVLVAIAAIAGGLFWILLNRKNWGTTEVTETETEIPDKKKLTGFKRVLPFAALLVPLLLMSIGTIFPGDNPIISFIKNPVWALMIGVAFALPLLGTKNFSTDLNRYFQSAGAKCAIVILITGTGGAFGQVIKDTEIVNSLFSDVGNLAAMGIVIPFLLSFLFTTVTGSITVSLITSSSIIAPLVSNGTLDPAFTAAAIGAGSLGIIHVNSSFFWLFKEVHHLPVGKLLKSFSVLSAITALSSGLVLILIYFFIGS
ncbi:gluconate:H+ symporter, GntP family [Pricia antarctica]|uniref:Gluconate:H+ symporter, GntP family n=1 Tax=Pricia antarctica TaxID=641691 RepID=A0A1G7CTF5_9FLAO|nr:SLC13 family permease [Pricia antarctica]SDE42533.1 gluconate:H+ symporter, GntP family [Pricia antarctica]